MPAYVLLRYVETILSTYYGNNGGVMFTNGECESALRNCHATARALTHTLDRECALYALSVATITWRDGKLPQEVDSEHQAHPFENDVNLDLVLKELREENELLKAQLFEERCLEERSFSGSTLRARKAQRCIHAFKNLSAMFDYYYRALDHPDEQDAFGYVGILLCDVEAAMVISVSRQVTRSHCLLEIAAGTSRGVHF